MTLIENIKMLGAKIEKGAIVREVDGGSVS